MEEMVAQFLPFLVFVSYLCKSIKYYNPQKERDYETNDVIICLLQPTDHRNGRLDLPIAHHLHWRNRPNPDIAIKNVKIQPTLNVVC